jgi:hypothetical protein
LCKELSEVAARCSFAIFLAHKQKMWIRHDLVDISATKADEPPPKQAPIGRAQEARTESKEPNTDVLRNNGIQVLYHFTDAVNLDSIREHGLLSASCVTQQSLKARMNSDAKSREMDVQMGLENFVRLSLNKENPMKYVAKNEGRISRPVMLRIKLEVVSRPGVLFFDCNATRHDAVRSSSPNVVHFDVVKAANQFGVAPELRRFYQAEILVPSPVPPDLILFPDDAELIVPARKAKGGEMPKSKLPEMVSAELCKARRSSKSSSSTSKSSSTTHASSTASIVSLAEGEAATSLVLQSNVLTVLGDKGERCFAAQDGIERDESKCHTAREKGDVPRVLLPL